MTMMMSQEIGELATALAKAQRQIKSAPKDAVNPHFRSRYADLPAVFDACREALATNGIAVSQIPIAVDGRQMLRTFLLHTSGQYLAGDYILKPTKDDPQGMGSALTYARRYSLSSMVGVTSDDDDDGNAASQPVATTAQRVAKNAEAHAQIAKQNAEAAAPSNDKVELVNWGVLFAQKNNVPISQTSVSAFYDSECKGLPKREAALKIKEHINDLASVPG
jgi:ERF superfamily